MMGTWQYMTNGKKKKTQANGINTLWLKNTEKGSSQWLQGPRLSWWASVWETGDLGVACWMRQS